LPSSRCWFSFELHYFPQGLKPPFCFFLMARLKPCPFKDSPCGCHNNCDTSKTALHKNGGTKGPPLTS
jgi:hypothetical protein